MEIWRGGGSGGDHQADSYDRSYSELVKHGGSSAIYPLLVRLPENPTQKRLLEAN